MDTQQLAAQLERARSTAVILYTGEQVSPVEYDRLIAGVAGGELLLAEVARLHTDLDGARAAQAHQARAAEEAERAARVRAENERDVLGSAAKALQRVRFILGGHSGILDDCDDGALRLNAERALTLMRQALPAIEAALKGRTE